jgi:hypothetical protein
MYSIKPIYFQCVKGFSPVKAGVAVFPWTFTIGPLSIIVGILIAKIGAYVWAVQLGWILTVIGITLLTILTETTKTETWVSITIVSGVGLGLLFSGLSYAIQASVSTNDRPFSAGLYSFLRAFGQMLGVAVSCSAFQRNLIKKLKEFPSLSSNATEIGRNAVGLIPHIRNMHNLSLQREIITSYVSGFRSVWIDAAGVVGGAMLVNCIFIRNLNMDDEQVVDSSELLE